MELTHPPERTPRHRGVLDDTDRLGGHIGGCICRTQGAWKLTFNKDGNIVFKQRYPYKIFGQDEIPDEAKKDRREQSAKLGFTRNRCHVISHDTLEMELPGGSTMLLSMDSLDQLRPHVWWKTGEYAQTIINGKTVLCHRFLKPTSEEEVVDHEDGNGLNNCLDNLQVKSRSENSLNRRLNSNSSTGILGVAYAYDTSGKFWGLRVRAQKEWEERIDYIHIADYPSLEAAGEAAEARRIELEEELGAVTARHVRGDAFVQRPTLQSIPLYREDRDKRLYPHPPTGKRKIGCRGVSPHYVKDELIFWNVQCEHNDSRERDQVYVREYESVEQAFAFARAKRREFEDILNVPTGNRLKDESYFANLEPIPRFRDPGDKRPSRGKKRKRDDETDKKGGSGDSEEEKAEALPETESRPTKKPRTLDDWIVPTSRTKD